MQRVFDKKARKPGMRKKRASALSQFEFRVPLAPPVFRNGRFSHSRALAKPVAPDPKNKL
jgi:hypothetical protein